MAHETHEEVHQVFNKHFPESVLQFRPSTDSWTLRGNGVTFGQLAKLVAYRLNVSVHKVNNVLTQAAYDCQLRVSAGMSKWLADVEALGRCDAELRRWLKLIERSDTSAQCHEANVLVMKQWLWQVKRSINKQDVVWHVCPIFWSKENGTGKSTNVRRIFAPIEAFTRNVSVDELNEKFSGRLFAQTLVAFLDEFAGIEKSDISTLKAILTGKPIDRRSMHSESGFYSANRLSCIATSNMPPPHGFIDTTGARRLWSIHCHGTAMQNGSARMKDFDSIDVRQLWRAVLAADKCPHYEASPTLAKYMDRVREERLRTKTSLEAFCDEQLEDDVSDRVAMKDFMTAYKTYCNETRQVSVRGGYKVAAERLRDLGIHVVSPNNRYYVVGKKFADHTAMAD